MKWTSRTLRGAAICLMAVALAGAGYTALLPWLFGYTGSSVPLVGAGLDLLWNPALLLALQSLWVLTMAGAGRSKVTRSTMRYDLVRSKISTCLCCNPRGLGNSRSRPQTCACFLVRNSLYKGAVLWGPAQ